MPGPYYLCTENTFHAAFLVTQWLADHGKQEGFRGVVLREDALPATLLADRDRFHSVHAGACELDDDAWSELIRLYPGLSATERAMIAEFGVPARTVTSHPDTVYLGRRLNSDTARDWLTRACAEPELPYLFVFLDKILAPWWIELTGSRIVNAHSAVLPHARGTFAIEQVAALRDRELFSACAGATAHFVDDGVDTGPIIKALRFTDPFSFGSIWSCKGNSFMLAFDVLGQVAQELLDGRRATHAGVLPAPSAHGAPEFRRRDLTPRRQAEAEAGYLAMRNAASER
ncbi:formyltransferase family protein [Streptomyces sp. NPDC051677]|uniref:formyltransferase family protein n=1 Tax=Streptomyces sp. NPDC051677 TaxID=3365669 RepID=UPI0037CE40CB